MAGPDAGGGVNPATALATVLVDELVRCGMTDAVLAPGSRSAPLAMALFADGRARLHVRIDERSAGFLAVGLAKGSGRPVAVVCTSGTAAANLHPAVLEAAESRLPLILLTADRPAELRGTGANQTVDQVKLYGDVVRLFVEVGLPEERAGMVAYWRSLACRAVAAAAAGPVHLNLAFREPLVPDGTADWPEPLTGRPDGRPWTMVDRSIGTPAELDAGRPGIVVVGDGEHDPSPVLAFGERAGWPVLSEPTGNARSGPNAVSTYHHLLGVPGFAAEHRPEVVLTVGRPGLSRPLLGLLSSVSSHVVVGPADGWPDPTRSAARILPVLPRPVGRADPGWMQTWSAAETTARKALDEVLDELVELTEPRVARDLAELLPDGALLFAGSSMPIRDLNIAMRPRPGVRIVGNRGASGIDGLISAAVGAALAHGGPAWALLGDLSVWHDRNGLLLGPEEPRPDLTMVVLDNDGGGIFSMLPQAAHPGFERLFGTPLGLSSSAAATGGGVGTADWSAVARPAAGLRVVGVRTDRAANAALHARLQDAVTAAIRG
jgi:2-succinyl-5-enolpyruvyl-6-hydroxy-3-cyclohexene-1-carboxylate synthase